MLNQMEITKKNSPLIEMVGVQIADYHKILHYWGLPLQKYSRVNIPDLA